jgi:hypothetical protein
MKRERWVIYVCAHCGGPTAAGRARHEPGCRGNGDGTYSFQEIAVVPERRAS